MRADLPSHPEPCFLTSASSRRYAVFHRPVNELRGAVICVQAFNEELNRCRSMLTQQAQAWARLGIGTFVIDLLGTGDSDGEHVDARWGLWLDDLVSAQRWLDQRHVPIVGVLGIRLGALLAAEAMSGGFAPSGALIVWQPVLDGKLHLTQFMRVRIAASLDRTDIPKETTASLRRQLAQGDPIEVAGYSLHPEFVAVLETRTLAQFAQGIRRPVLWVEQLGEGQTEVGPASQGAIEALRSAGAEVTIAPYRGAPFWQVHGRVHVPEVIEATTQWLSAGIDRELSR